MCPGRAVGGGGTIGPAIQFDDVSKRFTVHHERTRSFRDLFLGGFRRRGGEEFWALQGITFAAEPGSAVGIIGSNGSGKSTLLKLATRILTPTRGRVSVHGRVSALLELGAGFHPELSGRDNIFLNASILGMQRGRVAERFDDIVRFAELEQSIDVAVKHYSSGMQARLGFAVAVHVDPDVLLIDEVLSVGDESFQERCLEAIYRFRRAGKTILLVSHDLTSIRNLCTEVIWIDRGRMRARGAPGAVVSDYFAASHTHSEAGASADSERGSTDDAGRRWGSHEAEIVRVRFENATGDSSGRVQTGDAVTICVQYRAHERIESPVFGLALTAANGTLVSGPNTAFSGFDIPSIRGEGSISYTIRRLDLLPGEYWLSASLYDTTCTHAYDYHDRLYPLVVVPGPSPERYGLVRLHACWEHQPADSHGDEERS